MRIGFLLLCFYWLSSFAVHASTLIDLGSSSCSGSQSFNSGDGLILNCTGDLSLSTRALSSDTSISLFSSGSLTFDAFTLFAPSIMLKADSIYINSNVSLIGSFIDLSANRIIYGDQPLADSSIQTLPSPDIIKPALSTDLGESIMLLPGGKISLISDISPLPLPITIYRDKGDISAGSGSLASSEIAPFSGTFSIISTVPLPGSFVALADARLRFRAAILQQGAIINIAHTAYSSLGALHKAMSAFTFDLAVLEKANRNQPTLNILIVRKAG